MLSGVTKALLASLLEHLVSDINIIASSARVTEKFGVIHQVILNKVVGILRGHLVVTRLNRCCNLVAIFRTETTVVLKASITVSLLHRGILVVVTLEFRLARLEDRVGLSAAQKETIG